MLNVIRKFYHNDDSVIYLKSLCLTHEKNTIKSIPLTEVVDHRQSIDAHIVQIDRISDRLACVRTEYLGGPQYCTDIIGMIYAHNNWNVICVLATAARYPILSSGGDQVETIHELSDVLLRYCHDVYRMDAEDCLSLFQQGARMYHPNEDGSFTDVDIQVLRQRWENMPDPVECGVVEFSRIYHIELLGPDVAVAKIGCAKLYQYFNDYLWLMKLNNEWKIVNKMTQCLYDSKKQTDRG